MYTYSIKKSKCEEWGYEITARSPVTRQIVFHNIAPSVEDAVMYLRDRFGCDVKYRIYVYGKKTAK